MLDCGLADFPKRFSLRSREATSGVSESQVDLVERGIKGPFFRRMLKMSSLIRQNQAASASKNSSNNSFYRLHDVQYPGV